MDEFSIDLTFPPDDDFWDNINVDATNIVIEDIDGNRLPFWKQDIDKVNKVGWLWVRIPPIPAYGTFEFYIYFDADTDLEDRDGVFDIWADGDFIDTNIWEIHENDGVIRIYEGAINIYLMQYSENPVYIKSKEVFTSPIVLEFEMKDETFGPWGRSDAGLKENTDTPKELKIDTYADGDSQHTPYKYVAFTIDGEYEVEPSGIIKTNYGDCCFHKFRIKWAFTRGEFWNEDNGYEYQTSLDMNSTNGYYVYFGVRDAPQADKYSVINIKNIRVWKSYLYRPDITIYPIGSNENEVKKYEAKDWVGSITIDYALFIGMEAPGKLWMGKIKELVPNRFKKYKIISLAFWLKEVYMVTFPKKYFMSGFVTTKAPNPSQRLSNANNAFLPTFVL